jgi:hypothetical protein
MDDEVSPNLGRIAVPGESGRPEVRPLISCQVGHPRTTHGRFGAVILKTITFQSLDAKGVVAHGPHDGTIEKAVGLLVGPQEQLNPPSQLSIARAFSIEDISAGRWLVEFYGSEEHRLNTRSVVRHKAILGSCLRFDAPCAVVLLGSLENGSAVECRIEPGSGVRPFLASEVYRDSKRGRHCLVPQASELAELDHLGGEGVLGHQPVQGLVERN